MQDLQVDSAVFDGNVSTVTLSPQESLGLLSPQVIDAVNSSDPVINDSALDTAILPISENGTDAASKLTSASSAAATADSRRVSCAVPEIAHDRLVILNASEIAETLSAARNECSLLIFYSPHCMFSARSAPYLNGIARYYPNISVLALQINESSTVNMKYGIVAIPTVLLLHNSRAIAKLNHTNATSLDVLAAFIEKHTGIPQVQNMTLLPIDRIGPLPSEVVERPNYLLLVAWIFTIFAFIYLLLRSSYAAKAYNWFVATWREAREAEQAQRPHQD